MKQHEIIEVGIIAAIISDNITSKLYDKMQERGAGYISTMEQIGQWAVEFFKKHKKTDWEDVLENGMKPLSKQLSSIICFDDAVIDFSYYKLENF